MSPATARRAGLWALLLVSVALLTLLLTGTRTSTPLDPANPGREGTKALVEVLRDRGVDVQVVHGTTALRTDGSGVSGSTVLLSGTDYLGPEAGAELLRTVNDADRLVVLVPTSTQDPGTVLDLDVDVTWSLGNPLDPGCTSTLVREGDRVARWDVGLEAGPGQPEVVACYPPTPGHNAGGARAGALLTFPATPERPEIVLLGLPTALTNEHITDEAHAALALRLLGQSPTLTWVVPQPGDAGLEGATSLWEVLPRNMTPSVVLLAGALLALAIWQGRRLGPPVTEPLPAVVHASQTTRSRGRLYRQARDRAHALPALQEAARERLAPRLGLPRTTSPEALARAVADATGRPPDEVERLLVGALTDDTDTAFVTTARELRSLEEGIHP